ncbi:MAG: extracellular solute-binding protein, partial [Clostridium sp.]|nr:extracellular solute-binding protein [Clostridium sp.]
MKRRIFSAMLATILAIATFAGCKGTTDKKTTDTPAPSKSTPAATTDKTPEVSEFSYPIKTDKVLTYWMNIEGSVSANYANIGDTPFGKNLMKSTGVTIEFLHPPAGQADEQFNLMIASGELPDIIERSWLTYPGGPEKAIGDGNIIALNEVLEKYSPNLSAYLAANPEIDKMIKTDAGNYYIYPFIRGDEELLPTIGPIIRKDWLEDLSLEMPTTIDEWYTVLTKFKEEKGATAPFSFEWGSGSLTNALPFAYAYGSTRNFYLGKDGKIHYGAAEEPYKEFLTTFAKWYKEGLVDPDIATVKLDQLSAQMTNGTSGASMGWAGSRMGVWVNAGIASDPNYMLAAAPYPTLNKGDYPEMGQLENPHPNQGNAAITTQCKDVELAARFLDFAYSEAGHMLYNFGEEGVSYTMINGYPTYTQDVLKHPDGWPVAQALAANIRGNYNGPFVQDKRYLEQYYTFDEQKQAPLVWGQTNGGKYRVPPVTPTSEESSEY